jgi:hypothetical protein
MNGQYPPPPSRGQDGISPISAGSEWSGVNNYGSAGTRSESPYTAYDDTNPISPMSDGHQPRMNNGFGPPPPEPQQRRPSENGSRTSSRAPSLAPSRSSDGTISDVQSRKYRRMEAELAQHYTILRTYLRGGNAHPPRANKARDKLLRLSPIQFHELSTDVYDELQRRQALGPPNGRPPPRDRVPPFLQPRPDFHEKRNQARQKLSSLQTPRFKDLSTDVFCELERRFPQFARPETRPPSRGGPRGPNGFPARKHSANPSMSSQASGLGPRYGSGDDYGRPMQRQFQQSTFTPNKSTMVEDEDELVGVDPGYERSSDAFGLESALTSPRSNRDTSATSQSIGSKTGHYQIASLEAEMNDLKEQLALKDEQLSQAQSSSSAEQRELQEDLERRLSKADELNKSMKNELDRIQQSQASIERTLRSEIEDLKRAQKENSTGPEVQRENEEMKRQLQQQHDIIEDVRKQATIYLDEMRSMAEHGGGDLAAEERLQADVARLQNEADDWKAKYIRARTLMRGMRASSMGQTFANTNVQQNARDGGLYENNGLVKDVHITSFQVAIDELLRVARNDCMAVLDQMKTVVLAVRSITTDIEAATPSLKDEDATKKRAKLKSKVSATANNLITASKNYAQAQGLSPVSLLDAAASHLTASIVDLVRNVKIRPTTNGDADDEANETMEPVQTNGYFNVAETLRRRSEVDSIYSAISTPTDANGFRPVSRKSHSRSNSGYVNGRGRAASRTGLGIKNDTGLGPEDAALEDLKVSTWPVSSVSNTDSEIDLCRRPI